MYECKFILSPFWDIMGCQRRRGALSTADFCLLVWSQLLLEAAREDDQARGAGAKRGEPVGTLPCLAGPSPAGGSRRVSLLVCVTGIEFGCGSLAGRRALCDGSAFAIWSRHTLGDDWSQDVELKKGHQLVLQGPYSLVRHPIYTAHLLIALGSAISFSTWLGYAAVASLFVGFQVKLAQEEELLLRCFPNEYSEYKAKVKALVPWVL